MSNYERTGHTVVRGVPLCTTDAPYIAAINIPPLTNMEATGCRLAMTGHSTLVIVSVYLPSPKRLLRRDLRALFALGMPSSSSVLLPTTSGQWSRRASGRFRHPRIAGSFRRYSQLIRAKTQLCAARASYTPEYRSRRSSPARSGSRSGIRNESWSDSGKSNHPTKRFGQLPKRSRIYPIPHSKPDNSEAIDDAEIAECLADSIETQCSHASPSRHRSYQSHRGRGSQNFPRTQRRSGSRLTQRSPNASEIT
ncbi:hypothetical protein EVAR_10739_1 [Eumeta japonica]|uniref:Uncharacterized protein n=1 Tax=Eumeta variegata TaxID=151549 RepID=A0A4C1W8F0_EUMVA|nr:hypothetical protein EVAR_10739_1 [Eumeta japonica]